LIKIELFAWTLLLMDDFNTPVIKFKPVPQFNGWSGFTTKEIWELRLADDAYCASSSSGSISFNLGCCRTELELILPKFFLFKFVVVSFNSENCLLLLSSFLKRSNCKSLVSWIDRRWASLLIWLNFLGMTSLVSNKEAETSPGSLWLCLRFRETSELFPSIKDNLVGPTFASGRIDISLRMCFDFESFNRILEFSEILIFWGL